MYLWGAKTSHYAYSFGSALEPARKPPYSISKSTKTSAYFTFQGTLYDLTKVDLS